MGDADAFLTGFSKSYKESLSGIVKVVNYSEISNNLASIIVLLSKNGPVFIANTLLTDDPTSEELAVIAQTTANFAKKLNIEPRIAMISNENFSGNSEISKKVAEAVVILNKENRNLIVDGEIQPDYALNDQLVNEFPFSKLNTKPANVLVFPNMVSANLSANLAKGIGSIKSVGPILLGLGKSIHIMNENSNIDEIVNLASLAAIDAQGRK